jgi:hypothetical protein
VQPFPFALLSSCEICIVRSSLRIREAACSPADDVIVNSTMLLDMQQLVGNSLAFINVDAAALLREAPRLLSPIRSCWNSRNS